MLITLKKHATTEEIKVIEKAVKEKGLKPVVSVGQERSVVLVLGTVNKIGPETFEGLPGVKEVVLISKPYKLASREFKQENTIVELPMGVKIGEPMFTVIAGPCAVENFEQILEAAKSVKKLGAHILRGSIFKPRSSPHSFQGVGEVGLEWLAEVRLRTGMLIETEVMDPSEVELVEPYVDLLRIGTRNMQNYRLLTAVGKSKKPVILKRALSGTIEEWLCSADYILEQGNPNVILCERGIRTFDQSMRNTLDLMAVSKIKELSHLPIIVDPSHSTGQRIHVATAALSSIPAKADGILIDVHPNPQEAKVDALQQLTFDEFENLMEEIKRYLIAAKKTLSPIETADTEKEIKKVEVN